MTWRKRNELQPGEMFATPWFPRDSFLSQPSEVHVVLDAKTEIGFWTGVKTRYGDVMPSEPVEVL